MKFIHTSDWHLGRQFHNVSLLDDQRQVLDHIIQHVREQQADALVIAGDIYDRSVPPATAVSLLDETLSELRALGVPVLMISGNHDSAERLGFAASALRDSGIYIFSDLKDIAAPVCITGQSGVSVNFYGIPYNDPEQVRYQFDTKVSDHNQAHNFLVDEIKSGWDAEANNVLISHCFIDGAEESDSERPLSIGGADRVDYQPLTDFNYVALGHLHGPQYRGEPYIRYSGSILKYSFSEERQQKSVTLVEIGEQGQVCHQPLALNARRNMRTLEGEMQQLLEQGQSDPGAEDYLLIRLTDPHAILDAMGQLRQVYPNTLHLEKPGIMQGGERKGLSAEALKRSESDMFQDFFKQMTGNGLSDEQRSALDSTLEQLHKEAES